ncbi:MAG: LysR family transcriptional regulator [Rhodoferax sp.]|nr:LysR family transcriptional regulator [Rhodoferax sp.]
MPRPLPSLDLLQVFEACGRCLSFTVAAAELGMTQPAVSQHIRRLELALGTPLFIRVHRGIELTSAGAALLAPVQEALATLHTAVDRTMAEPARELLAVATDFAFATYWLMPRLERFYRLHPRIDVSLVTSNRAQVLLPADVDLAIVFGDGRIPRAESSLLLRECVFPVCAPGLLRAHGGDPQAVLREAPWLQLKPAPGQHWFDWQRAGPRWAGDRAAVAELPAFDNYLLVIGAALAGQGVAIGWQHLVDSLLAQGLLCRLGRHRLESPLGYHLVLPQRKRGRPASAAFVQWLSSELPRDRGPTLDSGHG